MSLVACKGEELATRWVPAEAAVVRCTTAGRHRMPPVLLDLPVPAVPTGLLARQLDPMALDDMGFERDQPVCASLRRPTEPELDQARADVSSLLATYSATGSEVRGQLGRCACDVARAAGVEDMLAPCHGAPHRDACEPTPAQVVEVTRRVQPLREALAAHAVPRIHWRLAGRSDRPQWMVQRLVQLLPRHPGGITAYTEGEPIPSRHNHVLVRRLMDVPGVGAVLRLDGGRSVLVIRQLEGAQVLDLLSFPPVRPELLPLLPFIDEAQAERVVEALAQPARAWVPPLSPAKGNLVHLERAGMRAVDELLLRAAPLAGESRGPTSLPELEPTPLVDAVTVQADFGTKGRVLRARLELSAAGAQWAQTVGEGQLGPQLEALGLPLEAPARAEGVEGVEGVQLMFHRGPTERLVLDGLWRMPGLLRSLEMLHPNTVQGTLTEWDVTLPPGAVAPGGSVPPPLELSAWAERLAAEPYRLKGSFDAGRQHFELVLAPD